MYGLEIWVALLTTMLTVAKKINDNIRYCCDDSDIKIAPSKGVGKDIADDSVGIGEDLENQKENGNIEKAKKLGVEIASLFDAKKYEGITQNPENNVQARLLLAFSVFFETEAKIKNGILLKSCQYEVTSLIKSEYPELYQNMVNSPAFTMYYLCVRTEDDIANQIGKTYAKLVGDKTSVELAKEGYEIFLKFKADIDDIIDKTKFS